MKRPREIASVVALLLSVLPSIGRGQEQPSLAGRLDRCQSDLSTCEYKLNTEPLKSELDRLNQKNQQLQQVTINLNSGLYTTSGARRAQEVQDSCKNDPHRTVTYQDGRVKHVVTNLVIGTLDLTYDPPQIEFPHASKLTLVFEPRSVSPFGTENEIRWYMRAAYDPTYLKAEYLKAESGNQDESRQLTLAANQKETWKWTVAPLADFEKDKTDLICYLRYEIAPALVPAASKPDTDPQEVEIWRKAAQWTKAPEPPGWFSRLWSQYLNTFAAALTTWLGLAAALIGLVKTSWSSRT